MQNPKYYSRIKYIIICYHFLYKEVEDNNIMFTFIPILKQTADSLTKLLKKIIFHYFIKLMDIKNCNN